MLDSLSVMEHPFAPLNTLSLQGGSTIRNIRTVSRFDLLGTETVYF